MLDFEGTDRRDPRGRRPNSGPMRVGLRRVRWVALLGILSPFVPSQPARAECDLSEAKALTGYDMHNWSMADGLPQSSVTGIVQTRRHDLLLGTFGGLARFDGASFRVYDLTKGLPNPRVVAVFVDRNEQVWLGFENGGLGRWESERFVSIPLPPRMARSSIVQVQRAHGTLWASSRDAVFRESGGAWHRVYEGYHGQMAVVDDTLRLGGHEGAWAWTGERFEPLPSTTLTWFRDPLGPLWHWQTRGLRLEAADGTLRPALSWTDQEHVTHPVLDDSGAIWFGVGSHLVRLAPSFRQALRAGEASCRVQRIDLGYLIDQVELAADGTLWVGTIGRGLWRLRPRVHRMIASGPTGVGALLADPDGGYWTARGCRGVWRVGGPRPDQKIPKRCIRAMAWDSEGRIWAAERGIWSFDPRSALPARLERDPYAEPLIDARALAFDGRGRLWVAGRWGKVFRKDPNGSIFEPIIEMEASTFEPLPDGEGLAIGGWGQVVWIDGQGTVQRRWGAEAGVPPGQIRDLWFDGDRMWVGSYGGGVSRIGPDGEVLRLTREEGLHDTFVSAIVDDGRGRIWFNTNRGAFYIFRAALEGLREADAPRLWSHVISTPEGNGGQPAWAVQPGRLAFPTIEGLAEIDLSKVSRNDTRPRVWIESAQVDDTRLVPGETVQVPPGPGALRVHFACAFLHQPEQARFQVRFGTEGSWTWLDEPVLRREGLSPGRHRIQIRAVNGDGLPGPTETLSFRLEPAFTQTAAFRLGAAGAVVAMGLLLAQLRTVRIRRRARGLLDEIAQRQRVEAALAQREAHYRRVFESAHTAFLVCSEEGEVLDANPVACRIFRVEHRQVVGRFLEDLPGSMHLCPPTDPDPAAAPGVCIRSDGTEFPAHVDRVEYPVQSDTLQLWTVVDRTEELEAQAERDRLREQWLQSQRLEAVGRLAGGVAHDVNNMLTAMFGSLELAEEGLSEGDVSLVRRQLAQIVRAAERTGSMTRQLLAFARSPGRVDGVTDVNEVLEGLVPILGQLLPDEIQLLRLPARGPAPVQLHRSHLEQVIMNLAMNAADAMAEGGPLHIEVAETVRPDPNLLLQAPSSGELDGPVVVLSVEDRGRGIQEDSLSRIFEPFFTTKAEGQGAGLGLVAVHQIVMQAGGALRVHTRPERGTRIEVVLPRSSQVPFEPTSQRADLGPAPVRGRVAYCDDDPRVFKVTERILSKAGYQVTATVDPLELWTRLENWDEPPDLLITDVRMPGIDGPELGRRLRERWPDLPILYVSGDTQGRLQLEGPSLLVTKPYRPSELLPVVERMLAGSKPGPPA
jgi:C4-dicarboxylate-specific signal transduction histidine kinase/CheY-like chemotaxis protein/ligand-binding sensor domain-containing protein